MLLSNPRQQKLRAAVLVIAIAASVSLCAVLSSLSLGLRRSTNSSLEEVRSDVYVVPKDLNPLLMDLQRFDQGHKVVEELNGSPFPPDHIAPRLSDTIFIGLIDGSLDEVLATGVDPSSETYFGQFRTEDGTWFTVLRDEAREVFTQTGNISSGTFSYELLVSERLSRDEGLGPGDTLNVHPSAEGGELLIYRVTGVFVNELSRLDRSVLLKLGELQSMRGGLKRDSMTEILLSFPDREAKDGAISWAGSDGFLFKDIVDLRSRDDILSEVREFTRLVDAFSVIVVTSTALVCLFFTTTLFSISARRRSRHLATVRAIGISIPRIVVMVVTESLAYFSVGTLLGIGASLALVEVLDDLMVENLSVLPSSFRLFVLDPMLLMYIIGAAFVLSILSGLVPAMIMSMRAPHEQLQEASD